MNDVLDSISIVRDMVLDGKTKQDIVSELNNVYKMVEKGQAQQESPDIRDMARTVSNIETVYKDASIALDIYSLPTIKEYLLGRLRNNKEDTYLYLTIGIFNFIADSKRL